MFSIDTLRTARDWLIAEIETDRVIVQEPYAIDDINALSDGRLRVMCSGQYGFSNLTSLDAKKENVGIRPVVYIPWSDRLILNAAIIQNYEAIKVGLGDQTANYDRPLPASASDIYLRKDYRESYQAFRRHIISDENNGKYIIHTDIKSFAGSVQKKDFLNIAQAIGMSEESLEIFKRAFDRWSDKGVEGIPQGYGFTDIMLKIMMIPIDEFMQSSFPNVDYYRYADDIQMSSDDSVQLNDAFEHLKGALAQRRMSLHTDKTVFAKPDQTGVRHAFDSKRFLNDFYESVEQARWWEGEWDGNDFLKQAYRSFVYPGDAETHNAPKYLVSHILRQMRKNDITDFVDDLPKLMDKYPQRTFKLLKYAGEAKMDGRRPLNRLAYYFFNEQNIGDASMDVQRLEYLSVLKRNSFPISEFDKRIIASFLPGFVARNKFACGYLREPAFSFDDKALTPDLKAVPK